MAGSTDAKGLTMNTKNVLPRIILTGLLLFVPAVRAQIVNDGATNTLSSVTTNITGDVTVGTNLSFTLLVLSDNALLTNSANGVIGRIDTSRSNEVRLASARWLMGSALHVGSSGAANRLTISNGAVVADVDGFLGHDPGANDNVAVVTGAGSLWTNSDGLLVGYGSVRNQLVVSNGGVVANGNGHLGYFASANSNVAVVTGAGSMWSNRLNLNVGLDGAGNQLVVSNGAVVADVEGYLGLAATSSNNTVLVTGAGSRWSNSSSLTVGSFSSGNRLTIGLSGLVEDDSGSIGSVSSANSNIVVVSGATWNNGSELTVGYSGSSSRLDVNSGGTVFSGGAGVFVGAGPLSLNNRVVVDGGTLRASNATGTAVLDVRRGTNVLNAGTIDVDRLVLTNEAQGKFEFNGGTLITRGIAITSTNPFPDFAVNGVGATHATWDVRAGVSNHFLAGNLFVGTNSSFNRLLITNGAVLTNTGGGAIGFFTGANSNIALLSGSGSVWSMAGSLNLGVNGSANQLVVTNGAFVSDGGESVIGNGVGNDNTAVVTGAGSVWRSAGPLVVGLSGAGSRLVISDGGTFFASGALVMGNGSAATNNRIVVDSGTLRVTNVSGDATLDIQRGTNVLNAGLVEVDFLQLLFTSGFFEFNGGTLRPGHTFCNNGRIFTVGDGTRAATLQLAGGTHSFTNSLLINNHGTLTGFGTIAGDLTVSSGGTLLPEDGIGTLAVIGLANLQGATIMEAFKLRASRISDQVQVTGTLIYGGSLTVSNVGVSAFAEGDSFKLFDAPAYAGSFASLNLPPLIAGLGWMNKLLLDGSIEVVSVPEPKFASITVSGTNVVISGTNGSAGANYAVLTATNVALPLSNWVSLVTNQFDSSGNFSFTNPIVPGEPQRYFRIRTP